MLSKCPVCGAQDAQPFWSKVWGSNSKTVELCCECGSFFLWPQNTYLEQSDFDKNYASYIQSRAEEVEPYANCNFSQLVDDSITERLNDIQPWLEGAQSILEIGAEEGGLLDRLRQQIPRIVAVDAAPEYHEILRNKGYESYRYIEDIPISERFDKICFFSLLEHICQPTKFLQRVAQHLRPGGIVIIEVPSANDPLISLYNISAFKDFYFQAMHPQVFSPKGLKLVLHRAGFQNISFHYKQRYGLANHLQWLRKGVPGGAVDLISVFNGEAERVYIASLEKAGLTDSVYVTAEA